MARHFKEQDIDEFRECFSLYARNGQIRTLDQLTVIMRSLGMSPTISELKKYFKDKGKNFHLFYLSLSLLSSFPHFSFPLISFLISSPLYFLVFSAT
ncbi:calmodulin-like protein 4 [Penaeus monodon]|uniref:calmodulin-like protein 4 n=1 Tax=Penaeus monodon TaxID=6687 RepID=UPI0018A7736D|nr:calmodulin-like protein 4 [Penaeus monodon]